MREGREEWDKGDTGVSGKGEMGKTDDGSTFESPKTQHSEHSRETHELTLRGLGWNEDPIPPRWKDRFDSAMRHAVCEALGL